MGENRVNYITAINRYDTQTIMGENRVNSIENKHQARLCVQTLISNILSSLWLNCASSGGQLQCRSTEIVCTYLCNSYSYNMLVETATNIHVGASLAAVEMNTSTADPMPCIYTLAWPAEAMGPGNNRCHR